MVLLLISSWRTSISSAQCVSCLFFHASVHNLTPHYSPRTLSSDLCCPPLSQTDTCPKVWMFFLQIQKLHLFFSNCRFYNQFGKFERVFFSFLLCFYSWNMSNIWASSQRFQWWICKCLLNKTIRWNLPETSQMKTSVFRTNVWLRWNWQILSSLWPCPCQFLAAVFCQQTTLPSAGALLHVCLFLFYSKWIFHQLFLFFFVYKVHLINFKMI